MSTTTPTGASTCPPPMGEAPVYEWKTLPWRKLERDVYKLQKRIYRASQRGDTRMVHRLERLMLKSWSARCLAVRKVSQDNRGKKTAGVDGVKDLTPPQRLALVEHLKHPHTADPVRRVWIPKPGKTEQRPLGIPTLRDRAAQTLVRLALEPEWEARFEPNSYGFRPGRSVHDAIGAVFQAICLKPKFALDADIAACFDNINHAALLRKLDTFPSLRRIISGWLEAGVWDGVDLKPTASGTPQGGALSPLLANVALHGLETHIVSQFPSRLRRPNGPELCWRPIVVRYADDFVVLHEDRPVIEQVRTLASEWLATIGLELRPEKTRICHTLERRDLPVGFDFLGFTVRQFAIGFHRANKPKNGGPRQQFKTLIRPSQTLQARHYADMAEVVRRKRSAPQATVIEELAPKIRGWANFTSTVASKEIYSKLDHLLWRRLWRWSVRRHPTKSRGWVKARYWTKSGRRDWNFQDLRTATRLPFHSERVIVRHIKVRGSASIYDGKLPYWAQRLQAHPELPNRVLRLMKRQQGKCAWCQHYFLTMDDVWEVDHLIPRRRGGLKLAHNTQLLHGHCHDSKTATERSNQKVVWRFHEE